MLRQVLKFIIVLVWASSGAAGSKPVVSSSGVGEAWDISPADRADYYPSSLLTWPARSEGSAMEVRTISATGASIRKRNRQRRDLESESKPEPRQAAAGSKREARLMSPDLWAPTKPAVQFQKRSSIGQSGDHLAPENYDDGNEDPTGIIPPLIRAHYAPKTDFVTSSRPRPGDPRPPIQQTPLIHPEVRESRELALARAYPYEELYDTPMVRNYVREHDFDVRIPTQNSYTYNLPPERFRTQRDYYYRGTDRSTAPPYNMYDRWREEDPNYDPYDNRYRPTPKPKRIIYYATLPEIVRKPVDLRNYQRPYDPMMRNPETHMETERPRMVTPNNIIPDPSRRPAARYPYDLYDNYVKRSSPYDRRRPPPPYAQADEGDRSREQDRLRGNYKDKMRNDDRPLESQISRSDDRSRIPWPVHIGTEVNIKENERIPGRKIFGQLENYERYQDGSRVKKTSQNSELKEDSNEDSNNSNNESTIKL